MSDQPIVSRRSRPKPQPGEERFVARLDSPPLAWPAPAKADPYAARRAKAEHLCLWMACSRVVCRRARHCRGAHAACVFEMADVERPLLE